MMTEHAVGELEEKIGYCFNNKTLLKQALTHSSFVNEQRINKYEDYERLEFLGDAVLELIVSDYLFHTYSEMREGELTKMRATLVCGTALAYCSKDLDIGKYLLLGKGELAAGGRWKDNITADVMEAVIGAIYLDGGHEEAVKFINHFVLSDMDNNCSIYDSKTLLQEYIQKRGNATLRYVVVDENGPDHKKEFVIEARINDKMMGRGVGKTKKAAEQQAAHEALLASKAKN